MKLVRERLSAYFDASPIFRGIAPDWKEKLFDKCLSRNCEKDQIIFSEGEHPDHMFIILSGQVSIETYSDDGSILVLAVLDAPQMFGQFALLDGLPRSATARVTKTAEIVSLSSSVFDALCEDNRCVEHAMLRDLIAMIRKTNKQVEQLRFSPLQQRVARHLIETLSDIGENEESGKAALVISLTQSSLAERVSGSREKVNVSLRKLEEAGIIRTGRGKITILNLALLKQFAAPSESLSVW